MSSYLFVISHPLLPEPKDLYTDSPSPYNGHTIRVEVIVSLTGAERGVSFSSNNMP